MPSEKKNWNAAPPVYEHKCKCCRMGIAPGEKALNGDEKLCCICEQGMGVCCEEYENKTISFDEADIPYL